jgi:hypothetical protein
MRRGFGNAKRGEKSLKCSPVLVMLMISSGSSSLCVRFIQELMMRRCCYVATCITAFIFAGCSSSVSVSSDYDPANDFSNLKWFRWFGTPKRDAGDPLTNQLLETRVKLAVEKAMTAKGFVRLDRGEPDFFVAAHGGPWGLSGVVWGRASHPGRRGPPKRFRNVLTMRLRKFSPIFPPEHGGGSSCSRIPDRWAPTGSRRSPSLHRWRPVGASVIGLDSHNRTP